VEGVQLILHTDASDSAIGAVLQQRQSNEFFFQFFFTETDKNPKKADSTYARELIAIYKALRYLRHLEGRVQPQIKLLTKNNQSILEGLIRAMPQLTERNQLM